MNGKKHRPKRSPTAQKDLWTAVKDNAGLVTALIALFGVLITGAINTYIANKDRVAQQQLEIFNDRRLRELEQDKAQETALQAYLTDIGGLILDKSSPLRESPAESEASRLARAKTLTVLQGLNGGRKRILLQFLKEEELINTPDPIVDLAGADLSYAQLIGVDKDRNQFLLNETHLAAANLYRANMKNSVLDGANLSRANLTKVVLSESTLHETNLEGSDLMKADLRACLLAQADLSNARLEGATLNEVDLKGADLSGANLSDAVLTNVDLSNAYLTDANLTAANLNGANLSDAYLTNVDLSDAYLSDAYLTNAYLTNVNLSGANLTDANLTAANLNGADLSDAVLTNVDLSGANLTDAYLTDANLAQATGLTNNRLKEAASLKGTILPNGQRYEDWLKDR